MLRVSTILSYIDAVLPLCKECASLRTSELSVWMAAGALNAIVYKIYEILIAILAVECRGEMPGEPPCVVSRLG